MKVLIVDDEYFACAALEKLVKEYFEEQCIPLCCTVFDHSQHALEYLNKNSVDLVLTDIRMSEMDGLELALQIQGMKQDTETVVISGYAEFSYAQTALKYNVVDYLLKPISRNQIYECLQGRVESYRQKCEMKNQMAIQKKHNLYHQLTSSKEITIEHLIEGLIETRLTQVVMVMMRCPRKPLVECKGYPYEMKEIKGARHIDVENPKSSRMLFLYYSVVPGLHELRERVVKQCNMSCRRLCEEVEEDVFVSVSSLGSGITPLYQLYSECNYAMNEKLINSHTNLFDYSQIIENKGYDGVGASALEYELKQSFEFKDVALTKNLIRRQLYSVMETKNPSLLQLTDIVLSCVVIINKIVNAYNYKANKEVSYIPETSLSQFLEMEEVVEYFALYIERIYEEMFSDHTTPNIVERLVEYVRENYFLNISLTEISKNILFLNQSYVSRLFTAQMQISFSRYLLNYRLEKAMECIRSDADISVQEVAILNGFYDCSYFVKQFKKQYGETPGYYQKYTKHLKEKAENHVDE